MASNTQPSAQYPSWNKAWKEHQSDVDQQIVDFYCDCADQPPGSNKLETQLLNWFKTQRLVPDATSEFKQMQKNPGFFSQQVEERVDELRQSGQLEQPQPALRTMHASAGAGQPPPQQPSESQRRSLPTDDDRQPAYRTPASEDGPASATAPVGKRNAAPQPNKTKRQP